MSVEGAEMSDGNTMFEKQQLKSKFALFGQKKTYMKLFSKMSHMMICEEKLKH